MALRNYINLNIMKIDFEEERCETHNCFIRFQDKIISSKTPEHKKCN